MLMPLPGASCNTRGVKRHLEALRPPSGTQHKDPVEELESDAQAFLGNDGEFPTV